MASLPLLFGSVIAGAVAIDYGVKHTKTAFASSGSSGTVAPITPGAVGSVPASVPAKWRGWVASAASGAGIPASVVAAQINVESGFNPSVTSSAGAQGIAQFEPGTFASYGHGSAYNPQDALAAYIAYMTALLAQFHGNLRDALAAYNAGPANLSAGYGYADGILSTAGVKS